GDANAILALRSIYNVFQSTIFCKIIYQETLNKGGDNFLHKKEDREKSPPRYTSGEPLLFWGALFPHQGFFLGLKSTWAHTDGAFQYGGGDLYGLSVFDMQTALHLLDKDQEFSTFKFGPILQETFWETVSLP
ncbi:MAG: hypothetical protein PHO65_08415, partial [Sulfurovum sp.]|nr:hypothetical protein [Sulfurovum sp.]